ncbi:sensor histidine kinase [Paludisphaera soli]|uniref:sensor histidine kinase n=1 Tax=Paludisphaera soli TaxID=2712865 RepID=UPI0013EDE666|nr:ATP-binding protein [Paludisphaera soli]
MTIDDHSGSGRHGDGGGEASEDVEELIWTADAAGAAVGFDGRWEAAVGMSTAAGLGRGWLDALHPDDRESFDRAWREARERGRPFATEVRLRRGAGGPTFLMRARIAPVRDGSGAVGQWVVVLTRRCDAPRRDRDVLEPFAAIAAHDLQEPLRKIAAFGGRLAERCGPMLDPRGREDLGRMIAAAHRMRGLIAGLLEIARASGRARPRVEVDLSAVAAGVLSDLEDLVARTGGRVEVGPLPTIRADPTQMRQLLQNLIANALKFHRPGVAPSVRVSARAVPGEDGSPACLLEVADDGVGFDEAHLGRILRPFERLHGRDAFEGSGLGLAICLGIVEAHSGRIAASSAPGEGSTFRVTLPTPPATSGTEPMPHADATPPTKSADDRRPSHARRLEAPAGADPRAGRPGGRDV